MWGPVNSPKGANTPICSCDSGVDPAFFFFLDRLLFSVVKSKACPWVQLGAWVRFVCGSFVSGVCLYHVGIEWLHKRVADFQWPLRPERAQSQPRAVPAADYLYSHAQPFLFSSHCPGISYTAQLSFCLSLLFLFLTTTIFTLLPSDFLSLLSSSTCLPLPPQLLPLTFCIISFPSQNPWFISDILVITKWEISFILSVIIVAETTRSPLSRYPRYPVVCLYHREAWCGLEREALCIKTMQSGKDGPGKVVVKLLPKW